MRCLKHLMSVWPPLIVWPRQSGKSNLLAWMAANPGMCSFCLAETAPGDMKFPAN